MKNKRLFQIAILLILGIVTLFSYTYSLAFAQPPQWDTFTDPRYDFTVEYPSGWIVTPRTDGPDI